MTSFWANILFAHLFTYYEILGYETFIVGYKHCIWCCSIIRSYYKHVHLPIIQVTTSPQDPLFEFNGGVW